jgi:hypothetical protein
LRENALSKIQAILFRVMIFIDYFLPLSSAATVEFTPNPRLRDSSSG